MSSDTDRTVFPGHFPSSPIHSPRFIPAGEARHLALLDAISEVHLPGAYPASPRNALVGGNNEYISERSEQVAQQQYSTGCDAHGVSQPPTPLHEAAKGEELSREHEFHTSLGMESLSMNDAPEFEEEANHHSSETRSSQLPSRIDLHSVSPPPELPVRSPLRSGLGTRSSGTSNANFQSASSDNKQNEARRVGKSYSISDDKQLDQQSQIRPQSLPHPRINTAPTHTLVKDSPDFVSAANHTGSLRQLEDGADSEAKGDTGKRNAQESSGEDDSDNFIDAMDEFQPHKGPVDTSEGEKEVGRHGKHTRGNSLILKMKKTLSKAGRHVS